MTRCNDIKAFKSELILEKKKSNPYFFFIAINLILFSFIGCQEDNTGQRTNGQGNTLDDPVVSQPASQPNIIFLLTDDQRFDALSFAGNPVLQTPHIDSLAQNGVYFNNAYVTTSICAMSRASILTGQYARRHDVWDFGKSLTEEQLDNSYPGLMKKAGYTTAFVGKFGVGNVQQATADKYFDYWAGFNGQGAYESNYEGQPIHLTEKMGNQALDFLDMQDSVEAPFLLSMSFKAPHVQDGHPDIFVSDERYRGLYQSDQIEEPLAADEAYYNYFPDEFITNKNGAENVARKRWHNRFGTPEKFQENVKKYYELIHGVDVVVGRIMDKLNELDMADNTVIVFTSDNGFYFGEYGFAGKWYGSDVSIRVPMIMFDPRPNAPRGVTIDEMALNIDVAPTLLSIAGIDAPDVMQGEDLTQLITVNASNWRQDFLYEHLWPSSDAYYIPSTEGVVTEGHKYMRYFLNRDFDNVMFEEFYDREQDADETNNRMADPTYSSQINQLKQKLEIMRDEAK
ncbi:MAG: sulfatase [Bacteroidota bacterium]